MSETATCFSDFPFTSEADINRRVVEMIREQYSIEDEIKLLRTAPSPEFELWNAYVEDCREWGRLQKAELWTR